MKTKLAILSILFCFAVPAIAQQSTTLSDVSYLRKLSLHLRAQKPSPAEYDELEKLRTPEEKKAYFDQKIHDYLTSTQGQDRMIFRLSETFQVRVPDYGLMTFDPHTRDRDVNNGQLGLNSPNSMNSLFASLVRENKSWDTLLTGKDYQVFPSSSSVDYEFFRPLAPQLPATPANGSYSSSQGDTPVIGMPIHFAANDDRIAGVLTTPRFLDRYNTTNLNKNRRRAAAVFRTFLCDPMFPVIPPPSDRKSAFLHDSFSDRDHNQATEAQLHDSFQVSAADRHGADPKCAACHYKLDPVGRTFENIGLVMNPEAAPGMLTYTRANGELVKKYVSGLGQLGSEIVKQPEYSSCQVDWFWKQFIGADVALSPARKSALIARFDQLGRRTNDFIKEIVTSPEFRTKPQQDGVVLFPQVSGLLQRCDSCHAGRMPTFSGGNISKDLLLRMRFRVNIPEGQPGKMPMDWMNWDTHQLEIVKQWINQGAHDAAGVAHLSPEDLKGQK